MIGLVERRVKEGAVGLLKAAHLKGPPASPKALLRVQKKPEFCACSLGPSWRLVMYRFEHPPEKKPISESWFNPAFPRC